MTLRNVSLTVFCVFLAACGNTPSSEPPKEMPYSEEEAVQLAEEWMALALARDPEAEKGYCDKGVDFYGRVYSEVNSLVPIVDFELNERSNPVYYIKWTVPSDKTGRLPGPDLFFVLSQDHKEQAIARGLGTESDVYAYNWCVFVPQKY